ncbi:hypothetical protein P7C70_g7331, partial [Phenoliferia sp. Uapishka_3]
MDHAKHLKVVGPYGFTECQTIQLSNEIDEFHLRHSLASPGVPPKLWMPSRLLSSAPASPLSTTWAAYLSPHLAEFPTPKPTSAEIYGVWLEGLSPVLTAHAALASFKLKDLDIHIIETTPTGPHQRALFEELLHLLPTVVNLRLHFFVAPSPDATPASSSSAIPAKSEPQKICPACTALHRTRTHIVHATPYSSYASTLAATLSPSLMLALDPSLSASALLSPPTPPSSTTSEEDDVESWSTILDFISSKGWKAVFTAPTEKDGKEDRDVARGVVGVGKEGSLKVVERNAWAGGWPKVDGWE